MRRIKWYAGFAGQASPALALLAGYQMAAAAEAFGHHFYFNTAVADAMPLPILRSLIGHELAHVYHYATPGSYANAFPPDHAAKEAEADATADDWGFSMQDLRAYRYAKPQTHSGATFRTGASTFSFETWRLTISKKCKT